jgi:hypothetical protein
MRKIVWTMVLAAAALAVAGAVWAPADGPADGSHRVVVQALRDGLLLRGDFEQANGVLAVRIRVENHRTRPVTLRLHRCGRVTAARLYRPAALHLRALEAVAPCRAGRSTIRLAPGGSSVSEQWKLSRRDLRALAAQGGQVEIAALERGRPPLRTMQPLSQLTGR